MTGAGATTGVAMAWFTAWAEYELAYGATAYAAGATGATRAAGAAANGRTAALAATARARMI